MKGKAKIEEDDDEPMRIQVVLNQSKMREMSKQISREAKIITTQSLS